MLEDFNPFKFLFEFMQCLNLPEDWFLRKIETIVVAYLLCNTHPPHPHPPSHPTPSHEKINIVLFSFKIHYHTLIKNKYYFLIK
jgi:hypothetical protein